ncbi:signal recognition particle subunit SRP68 [Echinops telfairi]|uniref:Signal recognition particle subunit SRP68 n=1 Tax=Echinops telfairi TaxID=9371 RepID=A0AC55DUM4_ECHTE|nr:signal recognition particle subunit SRP68 [Echinops telfairi]
MAAEKQVPGGGGGGGGGSGGGSGGGRGAGGEENKENERPSAGSKANKEFGDSLSLESILEESGLARCDYVSLRGYCSRRQRRLRKTLSFKMGNRHKFTGKKVTEDLLTDNRYCRPASEVGALGFSQRLNMETLLRSSSTARLDVGETIYEKLASAFTEEQAVLYNQRVEEISPNIRYCAYNIGDQSAINELMQMRLRSGGTEGLLAEKLEVISFVHLLFVIELYLPPVNDFFKSKKRTPRKRVGLPVHIVSRPMGEPYQVGLGIPGTCSFCAVFWGVWCGGGNLALLFLPPAVVQAESEETKERLFESVLSECRDAVQAVREELEPDQKQRDYTLDGESGKVSNRQYLHSYLTFIKLSTAIRRNENMAKGLQRALLQQQPEDDSKRSPRPQDLIRLYDIILQNLVELLQLPGLEEDKAFHKEIGLKTLVYKAYRCFFIAQSYVLVKKWSEALVLYDRVLKYANEVSSDAGACKNSLQDLPDVQELITQVRSEKCSLQAAAILDTSDSHQTEVASQVNDNKPLVERFETFCLDPSLVTKQARLVHFPPGFQPIPCKPLFFDLALNHVAFPPLEDKLEQKAKSGLTGYIKGIFGFRS